MGTQKRDNSLKTARNYNIVTQSSHKKCKTIKEYRKLIQRWHMFKRNTVYLQKQAKYLLKRCKIVTKKHKVARKGRKNNQGRDAKQPQRDMRIAAIY